MKIICILVTFNPDMEKLEKLLESIRREGAEHIVIDNSDSNLELGLSNCIILGGNKGIAYAQNIGIEQSYKNSADIIIFFDQDSTIEPGFVRGLVKELVSSDESIVAPIFYDRNQRFFYPIVKISAMGFRSKIEPKNDMAPFYTNVVISSGTAVKAAALKKIGPMMEDLFIDYVDTEWCLRASKLGYRIKVVPQLRMEHAIGNRSIKVLFFRIPVHGPCRRYYRIRNSFLLLRVSHVPYIMAVREIAFSLIHQIILILFERQRKDYFKIMCRAVVDGISLKRGKMRRGS